MHPILTKKIYILFHASQKLYLASIGHCFQKLHLLGIHKQQILKAENLSPHIFENYYRDCWQYMGFDRIQICMQAVMDNLCQCGILEFQ